MSRFSRYLVSLLVILLATNANTSIAKISLDELLSLDLEDLLKAEIYSPSAYTKISSVLNPASITVITSEDIRLTPARNINDLIEIYVPGAFYTTHNEGSHMGIRGIMSDRNVKFLLLVNGRNLNQKGHSGIRSELDHWDMSDIQRIEVIRGPGSVISGPGAIGGVISITTHTAETSPGTKLGYQQHQKYDSNGISFSHSDNFGDESSYYLYASVVRTLGESQRSFHKTGYQTEDIDVDKELVDHYADYEDNPQLKFHADIQFNPSLSFWGRYTESGRVMPTTGVKDLYDQGLKSTNSDYTKQLTLLLNYQNDIANELSLQTVFSVDSMDVEYRGPFITNDFDSIKNLHANFSEDEVYLKALLNGDYSETLSLALGAEYSWDHLGPGWNDDADEMLLGDGRNIVSDSNSRLLDTTGNGGVDPQNAIFAGDGFSAYTLSLFGEINYKPTAVSTWLLSLRTDYHNIGGSALSPRLAYSRHLYDDFVFKSTVQQSVRFNTLEQLWVEEEAGNNRHAPEKLKTFQVSLSDYRLKKHRFNYILYYNDAEFLGFSNRDHKTTSLGKGQFAGLEFEYDFEGSSVKGGFNYSFVKLINFDLDPTQPKSGISYSDYNVTKKDILLDGEGNSLNNWFNQAAKIWIRWYPAPRWLVHIDSHVLWDFDGPKDGIQDTLDATAGTSSEASAIERTDIILSTDAYEYDFRLNMSVIYEISKDITVGIYGHNVLGANDNKRYHFDTGNGNPNLFSKSRFIEEPRHVSLRLNALF